MCKYATFAFLIGFAFPGAAAAEARINEAYGKLQLHFEANRGQAHADVRFLSRGPGYTLYLTAGEFVLVLPRPNPAGKRDPRHMPADAGTQQAMPVVLRMSVVDGASEPLVSGLEELAGKANYFIGSDPAKWLTNVPGRATTPAPWLNSSRRKNRTCFLFPLTPSPAIWFATSRPIRPSTFALITTIIPCRPKP